MGAKSFGPPEWHLLNGALNFLSIKLSRHKILSEHFLWYVTSRIRLLYYIRHNRCIWSVNKNKNWWNLPDMSPTHLKDNADNVSEINCSLYGLDHVATTNDRVSLSGSADACGWNIFMAFRDGFRVFHGVPTDPVTFSYNETSITHLMKALRQRVGSILIYVP